MLSFPIGFRFVPSEEELILHYLAKKAMNLPLPSDFIAEVGEEDLDGEPPLHHKLAFPETFFRQTERYIFIQISENYENVEKNTETAKKNKNGDWRAISSRHPVEDCNGNVIAFKIKLAYFSGEKAKARKTPWTMEKFWLSEFFMELNGIKKSGFSLAKLKYQYFAQED